MIHDVIIWLGATVLFFGVIFLVRWFYWQFRIRQFSFGLENKPLMEVSVGFDWAPFGSIEGDIAKIVKVDGVEGDEDSYLLYYKCPKGRFKPHFHLNTESGILKKGSAIIHTHKESFRLNKGDAYTIKPKIWHWFDFLEDDNFLVLDFTPWFKNNNWKAKIE